LSAGAGAGNGYRELRYGPSWSANRPTNDARKCVGLPVCGSDRQDGVAAGVRGADLARGIADQPGNLLVRGAVVEDKPATVGQFKTVVVGKTLLTTVPLLKKLTVALLIVVLPLYVPWPRVQEIGVAPVLAPLLPPVMGQIAAGRAGDDAGIRDRNFS